MRLRNVAWAIFAFEIVAFAQVSTTLDTPYQVRYAANLGLGESYVNIINTGLNGAPLFGPGLGSGGVGNICVNAYVLWSDEELAACCSCLITPDAVVHLGVKSDLLANTVGQGPGGSGSGSGGGPPSSSSFNCGGVSAKADASGNAQISSTTISCPQFTPPAGQAITDIRLFFQDDYSLGNSASTNAWTFSWINIPAVFGLTSYSDTVSGGANSTTYTPSGTSYYQVGIDTTSFAAFLGGGSVPVATVSTVNNSGALVAINGHIDANVFIQYDYAPIAVPNISVTIKLVGSLPGVAGVPANCANSAALLSTAGLIGGYVATGTTIHQTPTAGSLATTETPFISAHFNTGGGGGNDEMDSLSGRCTAIIGNYSGNGICNPCKPGALGADKK